MTSILLHDYVEQVEKLIDENRTVEAIEHCRHILHTYPRHIDTYRVMGKALLEQQEYSAASDLFLRILSADPNDFISHVGLSIVYKEERQNDQALWHLERAYEIQPYNVAIQSELRQLYAEQTESRPGIIPLTRGALARLYMQGELYQQAISELRRILNKEPDRMDLQALLAEAYWRDDQRIDAEEVCLNILGELPNCIVANAILSEIWLQTGRIAEAQKYLQRLHGLTQQTQHSLDKETIAGKAFATEGAFPLPEEATVEFLETGLATPRDATVPNADWVGEMDFAQMQGGQSSPDSVVLEPESGMHSYDWLADIGDQKDSETAVPRQVDSETDWFSQDKAKNELNISTGELNAEWLADLRGDDDEAEFQPLDLEGTSGQESKKAEELSDETSWFLDEVESVEEDLPVLDELIDASDDEEDESEDLDWLDALTDDEPKIQIDSTSLMDGGLLDWAEDDAPSVVEEPKTPFWLSEMAGEELDAVQLNPEEALDWIDQDSDEVEGDDWLSALADDEPDAKFTEEAEEKGEASQPEDGIQLDASTGDLAALSDADDWMESAAVDLETLLGSQTNELNFPNLEIPELEGNEAEIPDWLDDEDLNRAEELEAAVSSESDPQETPEAEEPQKRPGTAPNEEEDGSDAFDWLDELSSETGDALPDPPVDTEGMPSWMEGAKSDEAVDVVDEWDSQSADIPQWLQDPVGLSDLDEAESLLDEADEDDMADLTDLLGEMEAGDEALDLDSLGDMDSLFADWVGEDNQGSLADLVGELEEGSRERTPEDFLLEDDDVWETAVSEEADEPVEMGLTGLLANLNVEVDVPEDESIESDEEYLSDILASADEDDWGDFLGDEEGDLEPEAPQSEFDGLDLENVSLTQLLSEADVPDEPQAVADVEEDDWLSDLTDLAELEEDTEPQLDEELGLTGMLANLAPDEEGEAADLFPDLEEQAAEDLGLTDLLAGIDYSEDALDSEINIELPEFEQDSEEPPLTEVLSHMEAEPQEDLPISAEDTTWLMQLEEDTGSLIEKADDFDMAEETGLDWLTTPEDEPDVEEPEVEEPAPAQNTAGDVGQEQDGTVDDWDDAMSWLEELAVQQEDPVGELPSVAEDMLDGELDAPVDSTTDWDDELEDGHLDWLTDLTESEEEAALAATDEDTVPDLFQMEAPEKEEAFGLDDLDDDDGLSWLDELATGRLEGVLPEEAETETELEAFPEESDMAEDSWLDELAIPDEAEEGLPDFDTWEEADELADFSLGVSDADLDWLDATSDEAEEIAEELDTAVPDEEAQELSEEEYLVTGVTDALKVSSRIEEAEADLEEALAWLDELDDEGDVELPDEAPPTLHTPTYQEPQEFDWDDEPETLIVTPEADELTLALDRLEQQVKDEGLLVPETAVAPLLLSNDELNDALDWIEQMETAPSAEAELLPPAEAEETEALVLESDESIDEMAAAVPVVDDLDTDVEVGLAAMADDPEAWLEQLLSDDADMAIEMQPPPIKPSEDAVFVTDDGLEAAEVELPDSLLDDVSPDEVPEDPDAAVAWLDQLISGDADLDIEMEPPPIKPSEDAVYTTDDAAFEDAEEAEQITLPPAEPADEADEFSLEDDPEAWLEQLLGDADLEVDMEPPPIKPSEDAVYVTDDASLVAAEEPELEAEAEEVELAEEQEMVAEAQADDAFDLGAMEDDPEAWLEQLLADDLEMAVEMEPPPIKPSEDAVYVTDDAQPDEEPVAEDEAPDIPESEAAHEVIEADIIADVPDDSDEAMAWLEQLAARQGAALEELPSVTDAEGEPEIPEWMAREMEEAGAEPDEAEEDEAETAVSLDIDTAEIVAKDEDIDSELPEWLGEEPKGEMVGQTDWLRALPEVDVDTWLSAEEEATLTTSTDEIILPDTGPLNTRLQTSPVDEEVDEDILFEPVLEPSSGAYSVDESKLSLAQESLSGGRIEDAIAQYKELVAEGSGMMSLIAELEQASQAYPQAPILTQVLGDAYMRNGQLQKALAAYRSALDQM